MFYYPISVRHEDWICYQKETERRAFFEPYATPAQQIVELRTEIANLSGRIKAELLAELSLEVERLIASYQRSDFSLHTDVLPEQQEKEIDYANQGQAAS